MTDLAMDFDTNDITIINGDLSLVDGTVAIQQDLQQRLQVWLGEWFLDTTVGVPYMQQVFVKNPNIDLIQADLVETALATPGVTQLLAIQMDFDSVHRSLFVQLQAQTSTGGTIQAQLNIAPQVQQGTIEGTVY